MPLKIKRDIPKFDARIKKRSLKLISKIAPQLVARRFGFFGSKVNNINENQRELVFSYVTMY